VSSRGNEAVARLRGSRQAQSSEAQTSEAQSTRIFADAPFGLVVLDPLGLIQKVNAAFCRYAKYSEAELVGSNMLDLVPPEDRENGEERFRARTAGSAAPSVERRLRAKDGSDMWGLVTMTVGADGTRVVYVQDLTEQRRLRLELEEGNEQLVAADREKDELISVVSHELRTPLTSIMGYLELALAEDVDGALTDACREYLLVAQRNSGRLYRLVEDLLFVSSSSAGRATLNLVSVDLDEIVRTAVDAARPSAVAGEVELSVRGSAGGPVVADAQRVAEVIENLLSNAVKFTPQHGQVDVEVSGDADAVSVRVLDTGHGIAEDDAGRLFERFFRARDAEGLPGAGLGLSIAKTIVDAHNGTIGVASQEGNGTSFEVRLPRAGPIAGLG
jgi:PAS domain S-box-containing protein